MFKKRRKKRKYGKKIPVNTDGDMLPEEMVKQAQEVAKQVGKSALKDIEENPDLLYALQKEMGAMKEPGPEDVLLLWLYVNGAITAEKALPIPREKENETLMLYLYSDGYLTGVGNKIYVNKQGILRLILIGAINDSGEVLPPYK